MLCRLSCCLLSVWGYLFSFGWSVLFGGCLCGRCWDRGLVLCCYCNPGYLFVVGCLFVAGNVFDWFRGGLSKVFFSCWLCIL